MMHLTIKDNKIEWLGNYPAHWKVERIKNIFREVDSRSEKGIEELLSVSHYTGVTLKRDSLENAEDNITNAETLVGYKKVEVGDLVINIMLAWNGSLGISPFNGITSPAYCVYRCNPQYNSEYFGYLFSTNLFKSEFRRNSTGIIDSRLRLYSDKFFGIHSFLPPKAEQDEIVYLIKTQSEKIRHFIEKKLRFIELLKEQRQNIITHAVTKGIHQNVKMKPSGVHWLDEVPEHWKMMRLKNIATLKSGESITSESIETEGDFAVYGGNGLRGYTTDYTHEGHYILIGRQGALCGNINYANGKFWASEHAVVVTLLAESNLFWLGEFLKAMNLNQYSMAAAQPGLAIDNIKFLKVFIPSLSEQNEIADYIKNETKIIDSTIAKSEKEIELIKEYRAAMIAEAVMGKIKYN
jgi:type I restriction enzyme S subunit